MIPLFSGITVLLCLLIVASNWLYDIVGTLHLFRMPKKIKESLNLHQYAEIASLSIVTISSAVILASGAQVLYYGVNQHNNLAYFHEFAYPNVCVPFTPDYTNNKMVVLRLDDVQAFSWASISMQMMEDAFDHEYPVVGGVIPRGINEDGTLTSFLKQHACRLQIAMHGYTHAESEYNSRIGEFATIDAATAVTKLQDADKELSQFVSGDITTFIPPQNMLSDDAKSALKEQGFVISSFGAEQYDLDTGTWDFSKNTFVPPEKVVEDCLETFKSGDNLCVVMLHPQDFANEDGTFNAERYARYTQLLNALEVADVSVVTFDEYTTSQNSKRGL